MPKLGRQCLRAACVLCTLLAVALPAAAQRDEQRALEAVQKEIAALEQRLARRHAERERETRALREVEQTLARAAAELERVRAERASAEERRRQLAAETAGAEARLERERAALAEQLRTSYMAGRAEAVKLLLSQDSPAALGRMVVYYDYLNRARSERIGRVAEEIAALGELRAETDAVHARLADLEQRQTAELAAREAAREQRRAVLAAANADIERAGGEIARLRAEQERLAELIAGLNEALAAFPVTAEEPFPRLKGKLPWPVPGRITGDYGRPRNGGPLRWNGVLLEAERGTPVRAVYHGRVVFAEWLAGLGLLVIVDHGDGFMTLYGHNEAILAEPGDWVTPGEAIGQVGDSGGQAKAGLYFEIRQNGEPVNPHQWIAGSPAPR